MKVIWGALLVLAGSSLLAAGAAQAQDAGLRRGDRPQDESGAPAPEALEPGKTVVVTATRAKTTLIDAPATMSVIGSDALVMAPGQHYGDLLRTVPGLNVIQLSARHVSVSGRQAANTLATGELALLDGRSLYHDFFGVLWDLVPVNVEDVKRIEVVRGPGSAVWGASALAGPINVITRSPREAPRTTATFSGGLMGRDGGSREQDGPGGAFGAHATRAGAPSDRLSYRLSAGYDWSSPYSRPVGTVPRGRHPLDDRLPTGGAAYPADQDGQLGAFENLGMRQPRLDVRVDQEIGDDGRITYEAGGAASQGIIHTGFGPFRMQSGSYTGLASVAYRKRQLKINASVNVLDVRALDLRLSDGLTIRTLPNVGSAALDQLRAYTRRGSSDADFRTQAYDVSIGHSTMLAGKHVLVYGGNARRNQFDISLAPSADHRNEFGLYLHEEFFVDRFRLALGGRLDKFSNLDHAVLSPRIAATFKPTRRDALRVSFNRAFRAPSAVENDLRQPVFVPPGVCCDLRGLERRARDRPDLLRFISEPFPLIAWNLGNPSLKEETLDAYELAYTRTMGTRTLLALAFYQADRKDEIAFLRLLPGIEHPLGLPGLDFYTPTSPPPGVPASLIVFLRDIPVEFGGSISLPRTVGSYLNLAGTRNRGLEASLAHTFTSGVSAYANYSFQATPARLAARAGGIATPAGAISVPPRHLANVGANVNTQRFLGAASVSYAGRSFHADVMTPDYASWTDAYVMVNATVGVKWAQGKVISSLKGTNLANGKIQQHSFGDIIGRAIFAELRLRF